LCLTNICILASLESTKDNEKSAEELEELREICKDVQEKIDDMIESAKSVAKVKEAEQRTATSTAPTSGETPLNDISGSIKRRHPDNSEDMDAKKPKPE
jgi:hypothetical protein